MSNDDKPTAVLIAEKAFDMHQDGLLSKDELVDMLQRLIDAAAQDTQDANDPYYDPYSDGCDCYGPPMKLRPVSHDD